jgi:membrane protein implicated in regulation of membrane protease activity
VIIILIGISAFFVGATIVYRAWAQTLPIPYAKSVAAFSASTISLLNIVLFKSMYQRLAKMMNDFENYRTESG